jgi:hypothetical protein
MHYTRKYTSHGSTLKSGKNAKPIRVKDTKALWIHKYSINATLKILDIAKSLEKNLEFFRLIMCFYWPNTSILILTKLQNSKSNICLMRML